jgi:hypothetical protein
MASHKRPWQAEDEAQLRQLMTAKERLPRSQIAELLGRSENSVSAKWQSLRSMAGRRKPRPWTTPTGEHDAT